MADAPLERHRDVVTHHPIFRNLAPAQFIEESLRLAHGELSNRGALVTRTGERTGRSPKDKFIVREPGSANQIAWGKVNQPMEIDEFERLHTTVRRYLEQRSLYVQDSYAGADTHYHSSIRLYSESPWHAFFASSLFRRFTPDELRRVRPDWVILHAPHLQLDANEFASPVRVVAHLTDKLILIAGTQYAGEIKKAIFSVMNYELPTRGVFPMHCAANVSEEGQSALFFGLSGTGKTTLSADPDRQLIGDDEHAWSEHGIFNIEGGCYAKTFRLSQAGEPQIWSALHFGSVLENVILHPETREPDFDDDSITENCRAAYPLDFIPNYEPSGQGGHPRHIFFLTCDAFGVLPPLARLSSAQAMYHFLSGYTAKVAGTETGITEPTATFSACFGEPFLPLHPTRYAEMLRERMETHQANVWLVNTGWTGGPYGVGSRMSLRHTRALLKAALADLLLSVPYRPDPFFGVDVPLECPGLPRELLDPRRTWPDGRAYDQQARKLVQLFHANFERYADQASEQIRAAGPRLDVASVG